jgi:hypothetical protein
MTSEKTGGQGIGAQPRFNKNAVSPVGIVLYSFEPNAVLRRAMLMFMPVRSKSLDPVLLS